MENASLPIVSRLLLTIFGWSPFRTPQCLHIFSAGEPLNQLWKSWPLRTVATSEIFQKANWKSKQIKKWTANMWSASLDHSDWIETVKSWFLKGISIMWSEACDMRSMTCWTSAHCCNIHTLWLWCALHHSWSHWPHVTLTRDPYANILQMSTSWTTSNYGRGK